LELLDISEIDYFEEAQESMIKVHLKAIKTIFLGVFFNFLLQSSWFHTLLSISCVNKGGSHVLSESELSKGINK